MNFVFLEDSFVHWGPVAWTKRRFESYLDSEFGIQMTLPDQTDQAVIVNTQIRIIPIVSVTEPNYNPKIERLAGPFYTLRDTDCDMYYTVEDLPIDAVKNQLIAKVAEERYRYELAGLDYTINGTVVSIPTDRDTRAKFVQEYLLGSDGKSWKFNDVWLTLSNADFKSIAVAIDSHVQSAFDWERAKTTEIRNCTSLADLDKVVLTFA